MQQTIQKLRQMKLTGMAQALEQQMEQPATYDLSFEERVGLLVDREESYRENRRLDRLLRVARLKQNACIEDIDYTHRRGLDKSQMAQLVSCQWVRGGHNLLISGPTGSGKTWLACALGNAACRAGISAIYVRATRLMEELAIGRGDGSYRRRMSQLAKAGLIIVDDWGLSEMTNTQRQDLLEILEERHAVRSTLITSQLPIEKWHEYIGNPTLADAIMDRLLSKGHRLQLKGESMRKMKKL